MRNINYSPHIRYEYFRPNYAYTNIINIIPQTNLYNQKYHKSDNLSGIKYENLGKNNYTDNTSNSNIISNSLLMPRNYATTYINNGSIPFNYNQFYRTNSPITNNMQMSNNNRIGSNSPISNNIQIQNKYRTANNSPVQNNYQMQNNNRLATRSLTLNNIQMQNNNRLGSHSPVQHNIQIPNQLTNNSPVNRQLNLNYNHNLYNVKNNSLYTIMKKNIDINNIFYSPQKTNPITKPNFIPNLKLSKSNQKTNYNQNNLNQNFSHYINIIPSLTNSNPYNINMQGNFINSKSPKLESIKKDLFLQNEQINNNREKTNSITEFNNKSIRSEENNINFIRDKEPKENFDPSEFIIIRRIGEGTYGKIYLSQWKKNNRKYAMKKEIIKGSESLKKKKEKTKIVTNFIKNTGSKGVIKIYGDLVKKKGSEYHYYVLMEIAEKDWEKELFERQRYKQYYEEKELFTIMKQLVKTLSLLQKNHITHRDIKPQNVLITKQNYKISDFGEARTLLREGVIVSRVRGTELYMSPILFNGLRLKLLQVSHNTFKSDVFSLGMCLFFATTLTFNSLCDIRELNEMKLIKDKLEKYLSGRYSIKLINILCEMLQIEESNRPDFITLEKKYFS